MEYGGTLVQALASDLEHFQNLCGLRKLPPAKSTKAGKVPAFVLHPDSAEHLS